MTGFAQMRNRSIVLCNRTVVVTAKARSVGQVCNGRLRSGGTGGAWEELDCGEGGTRSGGSLLRQQVNRAGSRTDYRVRRPHAEA